MRYTKEIQNNVCSDIKYGLTPQECSKKYGIPVPVVIRWCNLDLPMQRAKEIALRKYQAEVSKTEASLADKIDGFLAPDIDDDSYLRMYSKISGELFLLVASVLMEERGIHPYKDSPTDAEIIIDTAKKWNENPFIKMYVKTENLTCFGGE